MPPGLEARHTTLPVQRQIMASLPILAIVSRVKAEGSRLQSLCGPLRIFTGSDMRMGKVAIIC